MTEAKILANVVDKSRQMTLYYFDKLQETDLHKSFKFEDKYLNSAFWILAHLSVTENWLLLRSTGGVYVKIPWARQFGQGGTNLNKQDAPPLQEVISVLAEVHEKALQHTSSLSDAQLGHDNTTGFNLFGMKSIRDVIVHAIRHESSHAGHLGWICKLQGIKTL